MTAQLLHHVLQFLRPHLGTREGRPLFVGISGAQGSGKSTVTTQLAAALGSATAVPYRDYSSSLVVATLSIDDVYLTHAAQQELATKNPQNPLVQHRGVPGTHDLPLARQVLEALGKGKEKTMLPRYDKSAFGGEGDRAEPSPVHGPVDVVLFEGWCVGFRALEEAELRDACTRGGVVKKHRMQDLVAMNQALKEYDALTDMLDVLVHIDAEDIAYVYDWRLEQERWLVAEKGQGMSDEAVRKFVDGYMPAYELYVPNLRKGAFTEKGRQLRVVIGKDREVVKVVEL